jgi:hypothetical protein
MDEFSLRYKQKNNRIINSVSLIQNFMFLIVFI